MLRQSGTRGTILRNGVRALAVLAALLSLQGCTRYYVLAHDPPAGGFKVEPLRRQVAASVTVPKDNTDAELVLAALKDSGYFSTLTAVRGRDADVAIDYLGADCYEIEGAGDTATGTYLATLKLLVVDLPTLGTLPTMPEETAKCRQNFLFTVLKPTNAGTWNSSYDYRRLRYGVTFSGSLYTSPERQAYQRKVLVDQSVAKLLTEIGAAVAPLQAGN